MSADAVLGIDGALGPFSVALISKSGAFAPRALVGAGHDALERGIALLSDVLEELPPSALDRIVVTTGPGSFTGMRIAVAYAKSLAFAAGVPLVGVGSFEVLFEAESSGAGPALAAIAARTGRAHLELRLPAREPLVFEAAVDEAGARIAAALGAGASVRLYGATAGVAEALGEHGVHVISVPLTPPIALSVAHCGLQRAPLASPHALVATYGDTPAGSSAPA